MQVFVGHEGEVTCGCWTGTGKAIATGDSEGTLRVWNPKTGAASMVFSGRDWHEGPINAVAASAEKALVGTASQDGTAIVVNLVLALNRMALAEGLTLAKKAGLDAAQTLEVLKKSAAGSKCV